MKLLIYGSKGWIGQQFIQYLLTKSINYHTGKSRLDNTESLRFEIDNIRPTHIISFIGCISNVSSMEESALVENVKWQLGLILRDNGVEESALETKACCAFRCYSLGTNARTY